MRLFTAKRLLVVTALAMALLQGSGAHPAAAQPSRAWAQEGGADLLKSAMMEAFKKSLGPGGEIISSTSDLVIDPLVTASTKAGTTKDKLDAWLLAMGEAGVKAVWPAYGLSLSAGKIVVGGAIYGTVELIAVLQDDQNRAILFGKSDGSFLDRFNNVMADTPFIDNAGVRGLTADNLGDLITSETKLKEQWAFYVRRLRDLYGASNAETADKNWPRLLKIWRLQRSAAVLMQFSDRLSVEIARAVKAAGENAGGDASAGPGLPEPLPEGAYLELVSCRMEPDPKSLDPMWKSYPRISGTQCAGGGGVVKQDLYDGVNTGEFGWSVPMFLEARARTVTLSARVTAKRNGYGHGTRMSFLHGVTGTARFGPGKTSIDGTADSETNKTASGSATIEVFAPSLTVGARATLRIGVNWGPHFIYEYALKAK